MSALQCLRAQACKFLPVKNVHDTLHISRYTYIYIYVWYTLYIHIYMYVYTIQKSSASLLKMPKPTKQVSSLINCSLNMGINTFSKSIKLQSRQIPSLFFPSSLSQIPPKDLFSHQFTAGPYRSSLVGDRKPSGQLGRNQAPLCLLAEDLPPEAQIPPHL